jgi:hypothetical protein
MKRSLFFAVAAGLALVAGAAAAQPAPPGPGFADREQRVQERRAQMADDLRLILRIRPDQETAFAAFQQAMVPPAPPEERGPPPETPSTLDRLGEAERRLGDREGRLRRRLEAARTLYAALSPEQQKVFDALGRLRGPRGPGIGPGMGMRMGMGMPPQGPRPAQ